MGFIANREVTTASAVRLLRHTLMLGSSGLALGLLSGAAFAQTAPPTTAPPTTAPEESTTVRTDAVTPSPADGEEIVVTGIRASLERAMDIKRESQGVVDAISAEDIGKFPDTNLAESLQRIPGVSIDRRNGEGARVTVRGFGPAFNLVTVNGRQLATSDINTVGGDASVDFGRATSRSFDFSNLASEGVSRLEVYKTGRAQVPTGGIGATINVVTLRPLDAAGDGLRGSVGAKALYDTSREGFHVDPEVSGVATWTDPEDTFGISVFGAYQRRKSAAVSSVVNGWNISRFADMPGRAPDTIIENAPTNPDQLVAIADDSRYNYSTFDRERINASGSAQFRPVETVTITADALFAQNRVSEARNDQTNWFQRPFDRVVFDNDPVVATAVIMEEGRRYVTKDIGFEQQYRATKSELQSYGLNGTWEITDNLFFSVDGNHSKSKTVPDASNGASSTLFSMGGPVIDAHSVDFRGKIPKQNYTLNDADGNNNGVLDLPDIGSQIARTNVASQRHRINQVRADLGWDLGGGSRFDVGATYIDSRMTSARVQTEQKLGDWGITQPGDIARNAGNLVETFCQACRYDKFTATSNDISFRGNAVALYDIFRPLYEQVGNTVRVTSEQFDVVGEKVFALYSQATVAFDIGDRSAQLTAGVRYENTKVNSTALQAVPRAIIWNADNDFSPDTGGGARGEVKGRGEYNNLLPAIDFQLEPMDDVIVRLSYSKTLSRPDYGNLFASTAANAPGRPTFLGGQATGNIGNPGLRPLVSDNFDVSLEWYYDRSSYISAGFFAKKVKNFVGTGVVTQNLFELRDPTSGAPGTRSGAARAELDRLGVVIDDVALFTLTALIDKYGGNVENASAELQANLVDGAVAQAYSNQILAQFDVTADARDPLFEFQVNTPINNRSGNIYGFEIQGQHFFGDTGFGIAASYTNVNGDVDVDRGAPIGVDQFALLGLSDTLNLTGIYDKNGISARVSYNWRDKFLSDLNRGGVNRNPVFTDAFGTLDLSAGYELTENFAISLEAINLLSETVRTYGRSERQIFFASELKPRYLLGARYRF